ncbi:ABC transporter permease [Clostridium sp. ATCC 25772]|uniref:ABC transporter permease n=1 Tax=Clostridium sp. ATCC 25772 TaxID=1676991 RepID=UPI000785B674|nr:ABC transporter permease [Clostridium sp. ATCC 25772]
MLQLIKLEVKKYKLKRYIKGVIIAILCIMAFLTISFIDTISDPKQNMDTYKSVIWMINVLVTSTFLIYSSSLMAKIVIGEYRDKTILVMFSYPISRRKIILAKLFIVVVFAMSCILIGDILCIIYVAILDSIVDVVAGSFSLNYIFSAYLSFLGFTVMGGILSLVPFTVGMKKKSVPSTIVTAVLIVCLMQPVIGRDPELKSTIIKLVIITLFSISTSIYTLKKQITNVDNLDVA